MYYYSFIKEPIDVERLRVEVAAGISTQLLEVNLEGTDVTLGFEDPLVELQVLALAGILQAHTGEPLADYKLSGMPDSPGTTDYRLAGYYAVPTFNVLRNGEVAQVDYYAERDEDTAEFSDLVVSEAITYERDESGIATSRTTVATFYRTDDTAGEERTRVEYLEPWQGVEVDRTSRKHALNAFRAVAYGALGANAVDFLAAAELSGNVARYELGDLQPLIDWIDASEEPYVTEPAKTALTNSLKGVTMETIDLSPRKLEVKLIQGDDYVHGDGRAINVVKEEGEIWPANLTGALVELVVAYAGAEVARFPGTVVVAEGAGQAVRIELSAEDTTALPPGRCSFDLSITLAGKHYTFARGPLTVLKEVAVSLASQLPAAPTDLVAVAGDNDPLTEVDLNWAHSGEAITGFKVERKTADTPFAQIALIEDDEARTYTDTGRTTGTEYTYRVRAYNALGNSAYSNEDSATPAAAAGALFSNDWAPNTNPGVPASDAGVATVSHADYKTVDGVLYRGANEEAPTFISVALGLNQGFRISGSVPDRGEGWGEVVFCNSGGLDGYSLICGSTGAENKWQLRKLSDDTRWDGPVPADGDAFEVDVTGANIIVKINGVESINQAIDTTEEGTGLNIIIGQIDDLGFGPITVTDL